VAQEQAKSQDPGLRAAGGAGRQAERHRRDGSGPPLFFHVMRETPCPYLDGRLERKLLVDLDRPDAQRLYGQLSRAGFRRSHAIAYRPACTGCRACVPVRIAVPSFVPSRSLRRIAQLNRDLTPHERPAAATDEQFALFQRYLEARHGDGEMAAMAAEDYRAMVEDTRLDTRILELRGPGGALASACIVDWLEDGPSAVYSFFEPGQARRGLGNQVVLTLIELAMRRGLPYVYLGYWIEGAAKMSYKSRFRPIEALGPKGWKPLETRHSATAPKT